MVDADAVELGEHLLRARATNAATASGWSGSRTG
jgi:hypothetical protein